MVVAVIEVDLDPDTPKERRSWTEEEPIDPGIEP